MEDEPQAAPPHPVVVDEDEGRTGDRVRTQRPQEPPGERGLPAAEGADEGQECTVGHDAGDGRAERLRGSRPLCANRA